MAINELYKATGAYEQMLKTPEAFYGRVPSKRKAPDNISVLIPRTGTRKGLYFQEAFKDWHMPVMPVTPEWDEDAEKGAYIMPAMKAALKTMDGLQDMRTFVEGIGIREGYAVGVATDVELINDGRLLTRALDVQDDQEALSMLKHLLCRGPADFTYRINMAALGKSLKDKEAPGLGLAMTREHRFAVDAFSEDEVELYYTELGLEGMRRTPAGLRWPHPMFERHISEVDGIKRGEEGFEEALLVLYRSILGTPYELEEMVALLGNEEFRDGYREGGSVYGGLTGIWKEAVSLKDGRIATLEGITPADYPEISALATRNFREAPNYQGLDDETRQKYIEANTPEGIADLCGNPNNLCTIVVRDGREIVGYRVVRHNAIPIANGRRLHTHLDYAHLGVGSILMQASEQIARQCGYDEMEVHATGDSPSWFGKQGYREIEVTHDKNGVFSNGKPGQHMVMRKDLTTLI